MDKSKQDTTPTGYVENNEDDEQHKFFISITTRGANQIRKYLEMNERGYRYVSPTAYTSHARDYYLYGILDEVEKAGISLMKSSEFIIGSKKEGKTDSEEEDDTSLRLTRNIYSGIIDEMSVWLRKLTEILIEVVGFKYSNEEEYYRHYFLIHDLVGSRRYYHDLNFYYSVDNENIKFQIKDREIKIGQLLALVDHSKCWYAKKNNKGTPLNSLSSVESRLSDLLPRFTPAQKLSIGVSYQMYSSISGNIHVTIGHRDYDVSMDTVETHFSQIAILSAHIILICKDILKRKPKGFLGKLNKIFKNNDYPVKLYNQITKPRIKLGDFVIAYGHLAEVINIKKSKFGYKSYRVRYLETPPLPSITEDEFAGRYINLFQRKQDVVLKVRKLLREDTPDLKINSKELLNAVRKTVIHFWEDLGFKERAHGRPDLATKKIKDYLARINKSEQSTKIDPV